MKCPDCGLFNRLLSRFCRGCGLAGAQYSWQTRGGDNASFVMEAALDLDDEVELAWSAELGQAISTAPLVIGDLFVGLTRAGELFVFEPESSIPLYRGPLAGVEELIASPAALDGLLLAACGNRLVVADLVDLLELSPGATPRRGVFPLKGEVCSHMASDGEHYAALATRHQDRVLITVFANQGAGTLELLWTRSPAGAADPHTFATLCFLDGHLLVGLADGRLWAYALNSGQLTGEEHLSEGLAATGLLGRGSFALLAGADGAIYQVHCQDGLTRTPLAQPVSQPIFALGASRTHLVSCHGKLVRKLELRSGKTAELELPQYCTQEPLVGQEHALLVSNEGTVYQLNLRGTALQALRSRKLFTAVGSLPSPPVAGRNRLYVCGPEGELVAARLEQS
ncbi:MAG: hypothetical protein AB7S38_02715 [Vulcanimicrobiota bacterium]